MKNIKSIIKILFWILLLACIMWLAGTSCSTTKHVSKYESQQRGLLMLEGEGIYKNKGFYKEKPNHKKQIRQIKKNQRR